MKLFSVLLLTFFISTALLPKLSRAAPGIAEVDLDRVEESTLIFKAPEGMSPPKPLKTGLFDLKYLGAIKPSADEANVPPFFLFTARPCKGCLQDNGIYAIPPAGGKQAAFIAPGKIYEPKSRALILESRAFFGKCLMRQSHSVYVVFQKERIDRKSQLQSSVLIAELGADHMNEKLLERHLPRLLDTLKLVKNKSCREIEGRSRMMLKRPLDTGTRRNADEPGGDKQEDTKENQTDDDLVSPEAAGG